MQHSDHIIIDGPTSADRTLILAHGAGSGKDHAFLQYFAENLASRGIRVVRFDFPYMIKARAAGKRRPPDRQPVLIQAWQEIIDQFKGKNLIIGGKSLGGRIASMIADGTGVDGLVCLGYPFHAPGKPDKPRIEHLGDLRTPTLICQGTRDPFGREDEVQAYPLSKNIKFQWLEDGEHSFKPRKSSGLTVAKNLETAARAIEIFADSLA
ncbi:MAG TPA: alpha/beta hydrolase [Rhodospirillaceae bacterium]|nr:alpha/beta hydrolase [Rhodospirillaceae bacterium]HAA93895.1 alpha/beta hydrolase [Rhodospirillaceae bacterium]HAT36193.1 alpha/beta hydrolase [Rhodospirillaceae bacterium]